MPKGNPNIQTRASAKWQERQGIVAKSYKLKRELTERFAKACDIAGVSQAAKITELMEKFISEVDN
ncbi:MAG: chemotaxis protein [Butyrivibrio sp.]|nr:chemotaxis protein [Butyrivibrio sp.]